jgi:poly(3-hydroxybutyrate) depolymerase
MTIEGEKDDITGRGQTVAALALTPNLSAGKREHHLEAGVAHYGVFNGSRYRLEIAPRIKTFMNRKAAGEPVRSQKIVKTRLPAKRRASLDNPASIAVPT